MNRILLPLLLVLALGAATGYYLNIETGYVLVNYHDWTVETSVLGALATVIFLLLALVWGGRLVGALLQLPGTLREFMGARRLRRARRSFHSGVHKLLEGRWPEAEAELLRRASDHEDAGLNYLLAARAAQQAGAPDRGEKYLEQAAKVGDAAAPTARQLRAELQLERGEAEAALPSLRELQAADPRHPRISHLLCEGLAAVGLWAELNTYLRSRNAKKALPAAAQQEFTVQAACALMAQAANDARLDTLKSLWNGASTETRDTPKVRLAYVTGLGRVGADAEAGRVVEAALKTQWDPALVSAYADLEGLEAVNQLAAVEQWLVQYEEKPELLLAAGKVCRRNQLWGKARSYLDAALRAAPSPAVCMAIARLCEDAKKPEEAAEFYRRGLELATK